MTSVTPELMYEVLKSVQARLAQVDGKIDELKQEMQALRTSQNGIRQEITGVYQETAQHSCDARSARRPLRPH